MWTSRHAHLFAGALANLKELYLDSNKIRDAGVEAC